jgi:negative regulator of replication initiation
MNKTIPVDADIFTELEKLRGDLWSHSDVIRKLLSFHQSGKQETNAPPVDHFNEQTPSRSEVNGGLVEFVRSAQYQLSYKAVDKYLAILGWLYKNRSRDFSKVETYRRGNRVYFGATQRKVEEGGGGNIHAKQIPGSGVWALVTLDNRTKRTILTDLLRAFGFQSSDIQSIVSTLPDSGIHRGGTPGSFNNIQ